MIKQAEEKDIPAIEEILLDSVNWMRKKQIGNQWNENSIKWEAMSKDYQIEEFYIYFQDGMPAGCIAITDVDAKYWPEIPKGDSLYIHKLAVKRSAAGKGISKALMNFTKSLAIKKGIDTIRLDCNFNREKLRMIYENEGFVYVGKTKVNNSDMALYECCVK